MIRIDRIWKELKFPERQTKKITQKTEKVNEQKNRFFANMSHVIRVPLRSTVGFSQLITIDTDINEKSRKGYSGIIQQNTKKLMSLVSSISGLSRLEADVVEYQLTDYDTVQLRNDAICSAQTQRSNLHIHFQKSINEYIIHANCNRMIQIITNILTGFSTAREEREVHFSLDRNGEILCFKITNSPLTDKKYNNQEAPIHREIDRLLLKYFSSTYQIILDASTGPTISFAYPTAKP